MPRKGRSKSEVSTDSEVLSDLGGEDEVRGGLDGEDEEEDEETKRRRGMERMKAVREVCLSPLLSQDTHDLGIMWSGPGIPHMKP